MAISLLLQIFFIILLSPSLAKTNVSHAQTLCLERERALLLELKNQLVFNSSYSRKLVKWNQTDDCCRWEGVECDVAGHVISLELDDEGISGGFNESSSLFSLNYLEDLNLARNLFQGSLPHSISSLERLSSLDLSYCKFSGVIPFALSNLTQLVYVYLSQNFFSGSISSNQFEGLSKVENIDLSFNSLSGIIPMSIFTLSSLQLLDLRCNQFSGGVSDFPVANMSNLYLLDLSSNQLESPIPNSFFNLKNLRLSLSDNLFNDTFQLKKILSFKILDLSRNKLSLDATSIPSSTDNPRLKESSLQFLDLSDNKIAGEVPSWIWEIGNGSLYYLNLSCNMLAGLQKPYNIPTFSLQILDLHSNQFRGELPLHLQGAAYLDYSNNYFDKLSPINESYSADIDILQFLSFANNSLSGPFPAFICNYISLQILDLSVNNFRGNIPLCLFENFDYLQVLNLGKNNIRGSIPNQFPLNCKLRTLELSDNHLVGDVPLSLRNCRSLAVMNVGNNHIDDHFPCMLPSSLQVLVLRSNRFHGEVRCRKQSWPNLQIIDISSNNFTGYLNPFNFSSWRGMKLDGDADLNRSFLGVYSYAYMSSYYQDEVMLSIKGLKLKLVKIWPEFTSIDFSCNNFHGNIPRAIGELTSLYLLNLSHNALIGAIPESLGKLRQLGSLDLSMNQLSGVMPKEIAGLTLLQMMNVSHNKLVGKIPIGPQIQTFSADSFEGNTGLCGLPLNISCTNTSAASPPNLGNVESDREIEWDYVFAAAGYAVGLGSFSWLLLFCRSFREKYFEKIEDVFEKIFDRRLRRKRRERQKRVARNQVRGH